MKVAFLNPIHCGNKCLIFFKFTDVFIEGVGKSKTNLNKSGLGQERLSLKVSS